MRSGIVERAGGAALLAALLAAAPAAAQYREYYVRGKVLDSAGKPIADVEIELRDPDTSRVYTLKTDKDGVYKFAGLPHAAYTVRFSKQGYAALEDDWDLKVPQSSMKRVEMPDVVLASQAQVQEAKLREELVQANKGAVEKVGKRDFDGAIALLQEALRQSPRDPGALFLLGLSYAGKKQCDQAVPVLLQVTELNPDFPGTYFQLGDCYRQLGETSKALEAYDKHLQLEPGNADSAYNSGLILFETNRIEEAAARFEAGLAQRPSDPDLHEMVGRCYLHQSKLEAAVSHLEKARAASADAEKQALLDRLIAQARSLIQ